MKNLKQQYTELRAGFPPEIPDVEVMEMAEQDVEFARQWADFQNENPRFREYKIVLDLDLAKCDPAWLALQKRHPRFEGYRLVNIARAEREAEEAWLKIEEENLIDSLVNGATLRAAGSGKMNLRQVENLRSRISKTVNFLLPASLIIVVWVGGFLIGRHSVFEQLSADQQTEIRGRVEQLFDKQGDQK